MPTLLTIGDLGRAEFHRARESLDRAGSLYATDLPAAERLLGEERVTPDLIVLVQSYPGQWTDAAANRLRRLAPLARQVALLGSWCEGEPRTGHPCAGAVRVYWHQWPPRMTQELPRLRAGQPSTWGLPATATEEERLLVLAERPLGPAPHETARDRRRGLVAIHSRHAAGADWLSAACASLGYAAVWLKAAGRVDGAACGIYDGTAFDQDEAKELAALIEALGDAPVLALLDFPRVHQVDWARACGASAVLARPILIDDLAWQLEQFEGERHRRLTIPPVPTAGSRAANRSRESARRGFA